MDKLITLDNSKRTVFVSDLHGDFLNLQQIFRQYKLDGKTRFVFLGDYIDRGDFSFEVISYLYNLRARYPHLVYLLGGNHEGEALISLRGEFWLDPRSKGYKEKFLDLPLAVELGGIIATHGALPLLDSVQDFNAIDLNPTFDGDIDATSRERYLATTWGDFAEGLNDKDLAWYEGSIRTLFTEKYLNEALGRIGKQVLIRGHQPHIGKAVSFGGKLITIISTSLYTAYYGNATVAVVDAGVDTTKPSSVKVEEVGAEYAKQI